MLILLVFFHSWFSPKTAQKLFSGMPSEYQTVWIQIRSDISGFAKAWKVLEYKGLSWKVLENKICLEKYLENTQRPWKVLEFYHVQFNRKNQHCFGDLNQYKIVVPLFGAAYAALNNWERSGSVVECLTLDRGAAGASLTCVTALWSLSKTHLS